MRIVVKRVKMGSLIFNLTTSQGVHIPFPYLFSSCDGKSLRHENKTLGDVGLDITRMTSV
jgi:hypothetical protein